MLTHQYIGWIVFFILISIFFAIDLGLFRKDDHTVTTKEAIIWSSIWISLALLFAGGVYYVNGHQKGTEFLTAYFVELSLSIDNLFIFILIFNHFLVPTKYQHRVLLYGVIGAIVLRGIFIYFGLTLIAKIFWIIYIFGAFLIFTGGKMIIMSNEEPDLENNWALRFMQKHFRITRDYQNNHFMVKINNQLWFTPLFLVLLLIDLFDVVFAIDSIPAVLAITQDPFIVYTSNIFAILGLRSMYFVLAALADKLYYLKIGLGLILILIGSKIILSHYFPIPTLLTLFLTVLILATTVVASIIRSSRVNN
jgi:tellurite resistance protein TerC